MLNIFKFKTLFLTPLIKFAIKHPGIMELKLFLKAMIVFPAKISKTYDAKIARSGKDYHVALEQGLTRIFNEPQRILDLCTGTGFAAFKAAKVFPLATIDAVDHIAEMIDIARGKEKESDINNINFRIDSAVKLNYSDDEFDFILTSNAPIYLSEAARVLRPDGLLLVVYSFGGKAFVNAKKSIAGYFEKNGLTLLEIKNVGSGVYVLGQK